MRPFRLSLWCLGIVLAGASQAHAAWDNVFQVTCFGCKKKPVAAAYYYTPAAPVASACQPACPQPCQQQPACTTQYYMRSYYQPVTSYRQSFSYEPVTTYRTSYYYEPVTSYRTSCYYDPCSCSYKQQAVPTTSYQLRAQSCPVTSYLQRCQMVPETTYKQSYYYEPVTQCCQTTVGAPIYPGGQAAPLPAVPQPATPGVSEGSTSPGVGEGRDRMPNPPTSLKIGVQESQPRFVPQAPDANGYRQPTLQAPIPLQQQSAPRETPPPPTVRIDRIVKVDELPNVEGQVVLTDRNPQAGAQIIFVSSDNLGAKQSVTADAQGEFKLNLSTGGWLVYVHDADGKAVFKEKVEVKDNEPRRMILTSR